MLVNRNLENNHLMALSHYFAWQKIKKCNIDPSNRLPWPEVELHIVPRYRPTLHVPAMSSPDLFSGIPSPPEGVCWRTWDLSYFCPFRGAKNPSRKRPSRQSFAFLSSHRLCLWIAALGSLFRCVAQGGLFSSLVFRLGSPDFYHSLYISFINLSFMSSSQERCFIHCVVCS